ncbi:ribose-5-phosphate isomerase [Chiua virens]|nr:ribose-5-phosphate isomerase [Chiua virens]
MSAVEESKRLAAYTAVDKHILPHHKVLLVGSMSASLARYSYTAQIIGIGSGSTVPYVVDRIVQQGAELNKGRVFIPTGFQSKELIISAKLTLGDVDEYLTIDVTIDGADEVDPNLNCIKGGGACHLREKVLAEAAKTCVLAFLISWFASSHVRRRFIVVADYRKNSDYLGKNFTQGVPIEVVPFAYAKVLQNLREQLGSPNASLRMAKAKAGPVVTDNSNFVIDAPFSRDLVQAPASLLAKIKMLTGVVEVGLFCNITQAAYFGNQDGSVTVKRAQGKEVVEERVVAP